jgi:hypothetical protein
MSQNKELKIKFDPRDRNLLNKVVQSYNHIIVGEENNIKFLYCCYISKDLPRKYRLHAIIASQSSAGKSSLVRQVSEPFKKYVIDYTDFTSAFLKRQEEDMDGKILILEQMEKTNDQKKASLFELKFLLSEGKIRVGVVDKDEKGKNKPRILEVSGIPVFISTSTNLNIDQESLNRTFLMQVDESQEQTERIVDFTLKSYATLDINNSWTEELAHLTALADKYKELAQQISDIVIPFADKLIKAIPCENLTIRRDLPKILSLTSVIAFIHASNRYRIQYSEGENFVVGPFGETEKRYKYTIIADPEDFKEALEIAGTTISQTINKVNETSMKLYGKIIEIYDKNSYNNATIDGSNRIEGVTVKEVAKEIDKSMNRTRELMSQLETGGYLIRDRTAKEHTFIPTGQKFSEIKVDELSFSRDELESWKLEQIARHGQKLTLIEPPCYTKESENDTK